MITTIRLVNFKCFRDLSLKTTGLNVLAGLNGSGKSTIIQSLLVLQQSFETRSILQNRIQLSGRLVDLGTAADVYCADPIGDTIELHITTDKGESAAFVSPQSQATSSDYFLRVARTSKARGTRAKDLPIDLLISGDPFNYLHAERIGPRKAFQIPSGEHTALSVGPHGENAPYIIASEHRDLVVKNKSILLDGDDGKEYPSLQYQHLFWMGKLFPGFDSESELLRHVDQLRLAFALQRSEETGQARYVRPPNTGFGLSYALEIVVAGLVAQPDSLLIVENPEAHLHPSAQSTVGEFLARVAAGGAQVFIETHSEHVLNGIRRVVKQHVLRPSQVRFSFFANAPKTNRPTMTEIAISSKGEIRRWPAGFFDQLDNDLKIILE